MATAAKFALPKASAFPGAQPQLYRSNSVVKVCLGVDGPRMRGRAVDIFQGAPPDAGQLARSLGQSRLWAARDAMCIGTDSSMTNFFHHQRLSPPLAPDPPLPRPLQATLAKAEDAPFIFSRSSSCDWKIAAGAADQAAPTAADFVETPANSRPTVPLALSAASLPFDEEALLR